MRRVTHERYISQSQCTTKLTAGLSAGLLRGPVNTDIHAGVWRLRPPRSGTLTGGAILRPSIGEWVLGVAFVEATFIVASSCVRKHSAWSWSTTLQSVGTVAPLRYYRARNLGYVWCTASGSSIKPEGPGVQAICALPCTR